VKSSTRKIAAVPQQMAVVFHKRRALFLERNFNDGLQTNLNLEACHEIKGSGPGLKCRAAPVYTFHLSEGWQHLLVHDRQTLKPVRRQKI
jgi:hypothetical protein